ncbi:MAG: YceH family protein [Solirubrobacterales bacterium]|nr:YceH family protein [Solirubrobacterales bacterium]
MSLAPTNLDPIEVRILGCLMEKQRTTPDGYPLTLNALRLACNQSTNRDPVVDYDEDLIHDTLQKLHRRELTRAASGHGSRSSKYRHLVPETLGIEQPEQALLTVLLLRGEQTPGELKTRTERLNGFEVLEDVELKLGEMAELGLVEKLDRRPGEKQVRWRHLLGGGESFLDGAPAVVTGSAELAIQIERTDELAELKAAVARLEREVAELRKRCGMNEPGS